MRTRSTSRMHPDVEAERSARQEKRHKVVPLKGRSKTLQRNALESRAAPPPVWAFAWEFSARAPFRRVACFLRFHAS